CSAARGNSISPPPDMRTACEASLELAVPQLGSYRAFDDPVCAIFHLVVARLERRPSSFLPTEAAQEAPGGLLNSERTFRTLGDPQPRGIPMKPTSYLTNGGIRVTREIRNREYQPADTALAQSLDRRRGVLFSSSFEFPGRYTRWDMGFVDPPLVFTARGRQFTTDALNERGHVLLDAVAQSIADLPAIRFERVGHDRISGEIEQTEDRFPEESRSRQPSVFSVLRALIDLFARAEDQHLGLYGAFGYDLAFQFEPM